MCDEKEIEIIPCDICGADTSFERIGDAPAEGERTVCCDRWVCEDDINWAKSGDNGCVCIECYPRK